MRLLPPKSMAYAFEKQPSQLAVKRFPCRARSNFLQTCTKPWNFGGDIPWVGGLPAHWVVWWSRVKLLIDLALVSPALTFSERFLNLPRLLNELVPLRLSTIG